MSVLSPHELSQLKSLKIGMLGFGAQGSAEARNLRKSGLLIPLGLREGPSKTKAIAEGFDVKSFRDCVAESEILFLNLPDQLQAEIYKEWLRPAKHLRWIIFAHGFNTYFKKIPVENKGPAHILIAPKGAASGLEKLYSTTDALPAILSFQAAQPVSKSDKALVELLARALGAHPKGLYWADFKDECVCDLFSEQVLLCGGVSSLLRKSYEVLVEAGYHPETAYFETLYELKLIVDLIWKDGISGMRSRISPTARYGDLTRGDRVIDQHVKERMKEVLSEIESGEFADEFLDRIESKEFKNLLDEQSRHPIETTGAVIRKKMQA